MTCRFVHPSPRMARAICGVHARLSTLQVVASGTSEDARHRPEESDPPCPWSALQGHFGICVKVRAQVIDARARVMAIDIRSDLEWHLRQQPEPACGGLGEDNQQARGTKTE